MPKTIQHELTTRALVIFYDGNSKTVVLHNEEEANDWINRQLYRYGCNVIATDIFPNVCRVL